MAKPDKPKSPDEQAIEMGVRAVAVLAVAHACQGTNLVQYPQQFLPIVEQVARFIKTGKH